MQKQHETTIDDLPEEVLLLIFKLLDEVSLENAKNVCEMWRTLAAEIPEEIAVNIADDLTSCLRVMRNVKIVKTVKTVEFWVLEDEDEEYFHGEEEPLSSSELSTLKNLELGAYTTETFDIFDKAQLESLLIVGPNHYVDDNENLTKVVKFLSGQKSLKTLQMISSDNVFKKPLAAENVPFKLKELSLSSFVSGYKNILAFIKLHQDTLETLQLGGPFLASVYELVFSNLKKLKKLQLIVNGPLIRENFLQVNQNVTTLALFEKERDCTINEVTVIIRHLPNIESLVLMMDRPYEKLSAVVGDLQHLKHLTIQTFNLQFWQNVTFPKLESLKFVDAELEQGSDITLVAKNLNLRALDFDGKVDSDFLDAISGSFPNLVSLDLSKRNVRNADATWDFDGLRLREEDYYKLSRIYGTFFSLRDFSYFEEIDSWEDDFYGNGSDSDYSF